MTTEYSINTLHRGRYMLSFFILLFAAGALSSLIPASEIVKIIVVLFLIPVILYSSVKVSQNPSSWQVDDTKLAINFNTKSLVFQADQIDHIRSLTRSGGTLYIIHLHKKSPKRYWRNKLFQNEDDQIALQQALTNSKIEYYKF